MNSTHHLLTILIKLSHGGRKGPLNIAHICELVLFSYWVYLELMTVTIALCDSSTVQNPTLSPPYYFTKR